MVVDVGRPGGRLNLLLAGVHGAVGDVVADGGGEEEHVLLDGADGLPQGGEGGVPDVYAVDGDGAGGDVVEAGHEVDDGGLAAAGGAHEGDHLTGLRLQVHTLEDGANGVVAEGDALEADVPLHAL